MVSDLEALARGGRGGLNLLHHLGTVNETEGLERKGGDRGQEEVR